MTLLADQLEVPLTDIYNTISATFIWPILWKKEFVTVIPKTSIPQSFGDLRNISCMMLAGKVIESYVLNWVSEQVKLKLNQYGGVRGCSTTLVLLNVVQDICENAENYQAATVITSIDYAKAFNRVFLTLPWGLRYQGCIYSSNPPYSYLPVQMLDDRTGGL